MKKELLQLFMDLSQQDPSKGDSYEYTCISDSEYGDLADAIINIFERELSKK